MEPQPKIFLLVEDSLEDTVLAEVAFREAATHIQLRSVRDGLDAVRYIEAEDQFADRQRFPVPDVILLDLKMPRFSGFQFLEWLRTKSPGHSRLIPVIVISSSNLEVDIEHAYALGANSYMVKPINWAVFQEKIRDLGIYWQQIETPTVK